MKTFVTMGEKRGVMRKFLLLLFCFSALTSCTSQYQAAQQYRYHDDGTSKPKVAIVPLFDHSKHELAWDVSDELTQAIAGKLAQSGNFFLTGDFEMLSSKNVSSLQINPFHDDLHWLQEMHCSSEFIVFSELIDHTITPSEGGILSITSPANLHIAMRVKVVDIRSRSPRVVLQELFEDNYSIPWKMGSGASNSSAFSNSAFQLSPLGIAHNQMIKRIVKQVNDYVLFAKSRA